MADLYDDTKEIYFDDLEVGDEFISMARTVTETDLVNFAALIGWYDPLHCDSVYAEGTMFKKRVASGLLGLALSNGLCRGCISTRLGRAANMAFLNIQWSFSKPIFIGDTVHIRQKVSEKKETKRPDRGIMTLDVAVVNQHGETVQEGKKTYMLRRRPADAE
jgi:acyl dehydratase